jgi:hypothetical protein
MRVAVALLVWAGAWVLLLRDVEPVPTWFYVFAWYPTLVVFDELAGRSQGRTPLFGQPRLALSLLGWSVPIWLFFEAVNFRLANWYYVYLPRSAAERWAGIVLSFATVVPAVVLPEQALRSAGLATRWRPRPLALGVRDVRVLAWSGLAGLAAVLLLPHWLYPLTWGVGLLLADPLVYRRQPAWSLLADIERGEWGRIVRLMAGGLVIGGLWEGYNYLARGKWIYTVPLLEEVKWFEMPPLGFIGFPFFALEAWAMYHALAVLGVAVPVSPEGRTVRPRPSRIGIAVALALAFGVATLLGMERWTISSTVPALALPPSLAGRSAWQVARLDPETLAAKTGLALDSARVLYQSAQLATLRGIGTEHAARLRGIGISSVCRLAASDAEALWTELRRAYPRLGRRPTAAEVRVWVRAARAACLRGARLDARAAP